MLDILLRPNMRDPLPAPSLLVQASKPFADKLSLNTLPYHVHEILLGFFGYHFILYVLSPTVSRLVIPKTYTGFNRRTQLNWDIHSVSLVQSLFICVAALWVIFKDEQRHEMDWRGRLWGYTSASGMVQGFAAGYFLWDLQISTQYISIAGVSSLIHAIGALAVTCIGFKPFGNYYGLSFVLYELSTPFLNIHWFCDKLGMTGSKLQLYNGIALLVTFFGCRIVWGTYQSIMIYSDIYKALTIPQAQLMGSMFDAEKCTGNTNSSMGLDESGNCAIGDLPMWLVCVYLVGNTALSMLNFFWFTQMVKAVRKRFVPAEETPAKKSQ
ncbi:tlc domain-containing [Pyrenophora seminiperda CCB06]|uniref:Tlc domain-containing n=1 Tax=Pyrenophora seminiperda CCB06 TaxID=1302712 RepID=A0A3M7M397_9PLEO|nr:tlc domain-containing [Pyrenophora seminiperda CCB06]